MHENIVKSRLFKKYLKRRKSRARSSLLIGWPDISEKKNIENFNSVGAGASKVGKSSLVFGPNLTLILPIFGECKKGKLYILKKFSLSTFKQILLKYVYNSTVMFFSTFLFCMKGYSETLTIFTGKNCVLLCLV